MPSMQTIIRRNSPKTLLILPTQHELEKEGIDLELPYIELRSGFEWIEELSSKVCLQGLS